MSPMFMYQVCPFQSFPRVSGDEPDGMTGTIPRRWFSPRERG